MKVELTHQAQLELKRIVFLLQQYSMDGKVCKHTYQKECINIISSV